MAKELRTKQELIKEINSLRKYIKELKALNNEMNCANQILIEKEKKYRAIFENTGTAIAIYNDNHKILMVNTKFEELTGFSKEEIEGKKSWKEFAHKDEMERLLKINEKRKIDPNSVSRSYEFKFVDKYENIKDIYITVDRIPTTNLCVASLLDITDRKNTEKKLAEEHHLLRTLIDILPEFIYVKDKDSKFIIGNRGVVNFMGAKSLEDLIDKTDFDFYPKEIADQYYSDEQEIIRCGKPIIDKEEPSIMPNGEKRWISTTKVPLINNHGEIVGIVGLGHDITSHKNLEQQLQQAQKMEAIGRLTGGIAHDFNNMLTVIIGLSDYLLLHYKDDKSLVSQIINIREAGNKAASLTHQLLAFSRRQILQPKIINLNAIILDIEKMLRRTFGEDIQLELNLDKELENVKLDVSQIEQVIMNIVINAKDAMPNGGKLTIETKNSYLDEEYAHDHVSVKTGHYVLLSISDTGIGMNKNIQEHIFEPFFTTKGEGKGSGLGLSTVYGIVKQSEGNIWVYSEPNKGTVFKIYFPRVQKKVESVKTRKDSKISYNGTETILLVEDEDIVRNMVSSILTNFGYIVIEAKNGEDALRYFQKNSKQVINLIVTDVVMPHLSGALLIKKLRKNNNIKVLFMSGYTVNSIIHHGISDKETPFLQKPFTMYNLVKKVREVLDSK
ncbi:MAG: PAS domain S-box protein [Promethearchaeota archaeon]